MTTYSFTWKQWLAILLSCVVFSLLMGCISGEDMLPLWSRGVALGGVMIAAWAVYFLQRERHPALAETVSMLGLLAGIKCYLMLHSEQQLGEGYFNNELIAFLLITPLSFLTRQRLIIAPSLVALIACVMQWVHSMDGLLYQLVCGMALWLLGERWHSSSKYRGYSWVGVPGFFLMWMYFTLMGDIDFLGLPLTLSMVAVAALLFLVLRPRGGWELPKPLCVCTCLLPLSGVWNVPTSVQALVMGVYAASFFIFAARTGRRGWLALGSVLVTFGFAEFGAHDDFYAYVSAGVVLSVVACWWTARRMPARREEEPIVFPAARWQLGLLGAILCAQLGYLLFLYLEPQAELRAAPRALVPAQWVSPRKSIYSRTQLRIRVEHPLQESAFVGKSLWWGVEWADKHNTAPRPPAEGVQGAQEICSHMHVSAFLRQEGAGLWHIDRIEAPGSSEDVPRAGELCVPALVEIKNNIVCTLSFDTYPVFYQSFR